MINDTQMIRIIVDIVVAIIFFIGVLFPLKRTLIPYYKRFGMPSAVLISRFLLRIFLFILVVHNASFPIYNRLTGDHSPEALRNLAVPIYLGLGLLYLHIWYNHPDGFGGL